MKIQNLNPETKRKRCPNGEWWNPVTQNCEPIREIKGDVYIPKKKNRKTILGCSKTYELKESDIPRKRVLEKWTAKELRTAILNLTGEHQYENQKEIYGSRRLPELINLLICLENGNTVAPIVETPIREAEKMVSEVVSPPAALLEISPLESSSLPLMEKPSSVSEEPEKSIALVEKENIPSPVIAPETDLHKIVPPILEQSEENKEETVTPPQQMDELETVSKEEQDLEDQIGKEPSDPSSKEYNEFLLKKERAERNYLIAHPNENPLLYPTLDDPQFNTKIARRKEFFETKYDGTVQPIREQAEKLCDSDFELLPHQQFVKNFLSLQTPYNSLLLYHNLGTGKTCSAIGVAEEMRAFMKQVGIKQVGLHQRTIVVAYPNVQNNFRQQLFDESKLKPEGEFWNLETCIGNSLLKEINPTNLKGLSKERIVTFIHAIINQYYVFMGYTTLANYIQKKTKVAEDSGYDQQQRAAMRVKNIRKYFNNRLIIIDEVHNIRLTDENKQNKKTAVLLMDVSKYAENMRLLLLSATPMYNSYREIIWLTNLMNTNDKRGIIRESDVFDNEGAFVTKEASKSGEGGRELLERKLTGYVSYVRGENPFTFPYRIYPVVFEPDFSIFSLTDTDEKLNVSGFNVTGNLEGVPLEPKVEIGDDKSPLLTAAANVASSTVKTIGKLVDSINPFKRGGALEEGSPGNPKSDSLESSSSKDSSTDDSSKDSTMDDSPEIPKSDPLESSSSDSSENTESSSSKDSSTDDSSKDSSTDDSSKDSTMDDSPEIPKSDPLETSSSDSSENTESSSSKDSSTEDSPEIPKSDPLETSTTESSTSENTEESTDIPKEPSQLGSPQTEMPKNYETTLDSKKYPSLQMNLKPIEEPIQFLPIYCTQLGEYQSKVYEFIINHLRAKSFQVTDRFGKERGMPNFENMESFGYTLLQQPIESLNMVFPTAEFDAITQPVADIEENQRAQIVKNLLGKQGLSQIMKYETRVNRETNEKTRTHFDYLPTVLQNYGRIFSPSVLPKYSSKIAKICDTIRKSIGIVLIHSQYIDGGVVPIALALEEMGFLRYSDSSSAKSLFRSAPNDPLDALTMQPKSKLTDASTFRQAKYVMITGDRSFSPNNAADMKYVTKKENNYGEFVKVILITKAGSEGLDFKNIRQVHVLEPWYNMSRIDQIVGRAVRNFSHCSLPFEERNVQIYLHGSLPKGDEEPADLYVYRFAEKKAVQIGQVTRVLKQIAVDCVLHIGQTNFTMEKLAEMADNENIQLRLSSKKEDGEPKEVNYQIGDRPNTDVCDYMDCNFTCSPDLAPPTENDLIQTTYNDTFLKTNYASIVKRIRQLFLEQPFYKRDDMLAQLNIMKQFPIEQIDYTLTRLITYPDEYLVDKYGRSGKLINRGEYYAFQPTEVTDEYASILERMAPVDYKPEKLAMELPKKKAAYVEMPTIQEEEGEETSKEAPEKTSPLEEQYQALYAVLSHHIKNALDETTNKRIESAENDWYKSLANVLSKLVDYHKIPGERIQKYTVYHYLDSLSFEDRYIYLRFLNQNAAKLDSMAEKIAYQYFEEKRVDLGAETNRKVFVLAISEDKIHLFQCEGGKEWKALSEDVYVKYKDGLRPFVYNIQERETYNDILGFMTPFKEGEIVFKMKDLKEKRNNVGVDCRKAGRKDVMERLNGILPEAVYDDEFIKQKIKVMVKRGDGLVAKREVDNGIYKNGLCVLLEILLRYSQDQKSKGKVWFFDTERAVLNRIVKYKRA